ncbi:MAG: inositol monophosphatase family protein [Pseudomonadales bacterium]|nr:inositol monophosphatase family protein [Pseudomonadales bacterium]
MHPILNIALRAAREAAETIVQAVARPDRIRIFEKGKNDFVTDIDKAVEDTLIYHINKAHPDHGFMCEESGIRQGKDPNTTWIIDPIDGTRNFILGFPHFCISMACVQNNKIQHALILDPVRGDEFTASRGAGAQLNGTRMRVGSKSTLDSATISLSCAGLKNYTDFLNIQEKLQGKVAGLRVTGSAALDLAYVAAGRLDAGWMAGINPWDSAAGILLVQEAGGLISDPSGNPECLDSDTLIFGNTRCFKQLLRAIVN